MACKECGKTESWYSPQALCMPCCQKTNRCITCNNDKRYKGKKHLFLSCVNCLIVKYGGKWNNMIDQI